jgi:tetratricopeptide (TPR) repeat protein
MLTPELLIAALAVAITIIAVLFVALAYVEFAKLQGLRRDFAAFKDQWRKELFLNQKAQQRVMASYTLSDPQQKIALLKTAVTIAPATFNGYNALGWAYLELDDKQAALESFRTAIGYNPSAKEGYCDVARVYVRLGRLDLAQQYLNTAIEVDSTTKTDLEHDAELKSAWASQ